MNLENDHPGSHPTPDIPTQGQEFQTGNVLTVSLGHTLNDVYTSFLPPLLPSLITKLALSNTQAGLLAFMQSAPSLLQPLIGHLADRASLRYFVILLPAVAATAMSLLGVAPHYAVVALLVIIAGLSSAGFHASAPAMAGRLGPILVTSTVNLLTLRGTPWLAIGGWLGSAIVFLRLRGVELQPTPSEAGNSWRHGLQGLRPILIPVVGLTLSRAMAFSATLTFLPIMLTSQGIGLWLAGISLSVLQLASAAGALIAGSASDRLGRRVIIFVCTLLAPLLILALIYLQGWLKLPTLIGLGLTMPATYVILMALIQESCPDNRALATGVLLSVTFVSESVGAVVLGALADLFGLGSAFLVSALVLLAGLPLVALLPRQRPTPLQASTSA
jgi:FSR family fosmidomycin resistance protein-like MFS transporter